MQIKFGEAAIQIDATTALNGEMVGLFVQFNDGEEKEVITGSGKEFNLTLMPDKGWIEFTDTDSGNKFKMICRKISDRAGE